MAEDKTIIGNFEQMSSIGSTRRNKASCLVQYNGEQLGKRFSMEKNINIAGRSPQASLFIDEPSVSRRHAKFFVNQETATIEDLGSSNGSFINDKPVDKKCVIQNGDMIRLGAVLFKFFSSADMDNMVHDKIYRMVTIDAGTGVFNKKYLQDTLKSEFRVAQTYNQDIAVIYYDLDFFKKVNDNYGHEAGDLILKESAQLVKSTLRKQDVLCRYGGEEFVIILPETNAKIATELAERVRSRVENHVFKVDQRQPDGSTKTLALQQTLSIGVAGLSSEMKAAKDLLEIADSRLYTSKQTGRNKVTAA
ncbi:MAG: GGDEF domain-containing protein [Proteobacteria bacterium]|nr:GGDEF domain-containing protein [Pseudomonadota bacterium]